jgi:CheY-like chemotaxis protein
MNLMDTWMGDKPLIPPCGLFGKGRHILLAEDDDEMRLMLAMTLRNDGFEVDEARNGLELLDKVAPWLGGHEPPIPIEVIVSDVQMPCFTGLEILEGLAELRRRPAVILITAFGDAQLHATARSLGAAAVFDKPFDLDDLRCVLFNLKGAPGEPSSVPDDGGGL